MSVRLVIACVTCLGVALAAESGFAQSPPVATPPAPTPPASDPSTAAPAPAVPQPPVITQPSTPPSADATPVAPPAAQAPTGTQTPPAPSSAPPATNGQAQPTAQTPPLPPVNPAGQGTPATVLSLDDSDGIIGKSVRSAAGEDMGRIVDVVVTGNTTPRAAVIDFGGFLGVGSRKVAVDWRLIMFATDGKVGRITLSLTRAQVRATPEYKSGEPIVVIGAPPAPREATVSDAAPAARAP